MKRRQSVAARRSVWAAVCLILVGAFAATGARAESDPAMAAFQNAGKEASITLFPTLLAGQASSEDITEAVSLLEGIEAGNQNFTYEDRFKLGISNAEVHALLAYAYRLAGQKDKSKVQADIARALDANMDDTTVDQILSVLDFIP